MNGQGEAGSRRRLGAVLIAVLLMLVVVFWIAAELARTTALGHRQSRQAETAQQAFWLAESAAARAVQALSASEDYRGETWQVPGELLDAGPGARGGRAVIVVEPAEGRETLRRIRVAAFFPDDNVHAVQCTREWTVNLAGDKP